MDPLALSTIFLASFSASFFANAAAMPFDVVKSRIQSAEAGVYGGMVDCARKSVRQDGVMVLW